MKFVLFLLIIIFFLIFPYVINAEDTIATGNVPLNFSMFETVSADSTVANVNVTANNITSVNATNVTNTQIDFVSNTSLGNITVVVTKYTTPLIDNNLSSLSVTGLKYINITANNTLNSSVLIWKLIKIYYTDDELSTAGIIENSLTMYWYNTSSDQWIELTTSLDVIFEYLSPF